jgi:hypothetical protein
VTLQGIGTISVFIYNQYGNPVENANIVSTSQPTGQDPLAGTTDSVGICNFTSIYIGTYTIEAYLDNHQNGSITVTLTAAGDEQTAPIMLYALGIPGFPWEAIILGLIIVLIPVIILRRRRAGRP